MFASGVVGNDAAPDKRHFFALLLLTDVAITFIVNIVVYP